jgi:hypothetical protein
MPKGTTSKETVETRSYGKKLFYGQIPRIFGVSPHISETWRNLSWPFWSLNTKPLFFLETSGTRQPGTCRHIL